uniref:Ras guanyl-nucleotide exchange factor n=1 Tax=Mycena chlorophos TaxID=658473 RepID=A0ABQ0KZ71_MYCCL|nr:Ras guanyl-nucleotide exchange factor [Mycena chlorophos]
MGTTAPDAAAGSPGPSAELEAPRTLSAMRKSMSVDSFANYPREPAVRPNRGLTSSGGEAPRISRNAAPLNGRKRGASVSSVDPSGDSDLEREALPNSKPIRGGDLPLPPRTTLSSASSIASIMSASTASSAEAIRPTVLTSRARSGSLGIPPSARFANINTRLSELRTPSQDTLTLLVVGAPQCGKSVVIRKGLKDYGLSEPVNHSFPVQSTYFSANYSLRAGRTRDGAQEYPLHVIETDVSKVALEDVVWPEGSPAIDGVIMCYDASDADSFLPVEGLLRRFRAMMIPTLVLACKSDLERRVDPQGAAADFLQLYDNGLVEVSNAQESGKKKMRQAFEWLIKAVFRGRHSSKSESDLDYRNPASPVLLISPPPWETSRTVTPSASSSSMSTLSHGVAATRQANPPLPTIPASRSPTVPNSPTRARSTGDLLSESEKSRTRDWQLEKDTTGAVTRSNSNSVSIPPPTATEPVFDPPPIPKEPREKEASSRPWATLDELLDKLLFLAVSGDDPTYITHFLLTYRRFASPRSVLLAMQLRLRQLDQPSGDPMFACFAQMRICNLLEQWIRDYPYDFKVRGTPSALSALFKSITSKTYLLHYGADFLPFHEMLPNLVDKDAAWALKPDYPEDESDYDDDEKSAVVTISSSTHSSDPELASGRSPSSKAKPATALSRERKGSIPFSSKLISNPPVSNGSGPAENSEAAYRSTLKDLAKLAADVNLIDSEEIAQEITRMEAKLFLDIEPRHWLRYTFVSGKKDPATDSIARFNDFSNHLAVWVVSIILCHDKHKMRARQIEKMVEIAQKLRGLNNYAALRAFVAGINHSTFPGDPTMEHFKAKSPDQAKNLQSWDVLLQQIRSHRAYRLALRNTKGACIPALEVHMSDLIRAHEANDDINPTDPTKIHWGKFNMMGRFINSTTQCQAQCRAANDYAFPQRPQITDLLVAQCLMSDDMQKSRIALPESDYIDGPAPTRVPSLQSGQALPQKEINKMRKMFLW